MPGVKNILVVGDWIVDENWIVTAESSKTSSNVGQQQYVSKINNVDAQLLGLCGAGGIARLLHSVNPTRETPISNIFGLGFWDENDTNLLAALFRGGCKVLNQTPHTLHGMDNLEAESNFPSVPLCGKDASTTCIPDNYGNNNCNHTCKRLFPITGAKKGTNRVLRVYSQSGAQLPVLLHRYDFPRIEERTEGANPELLKSEINHRLIEIGSNLKEINHVDFSIVVIVDHGKGDVTKDFIEILKRSNLISEKASWYIRVKDPEVDWLTELKNEMRGKLKLLFLGPMLLDLPSDSWFLGQHLSAGALYKMQEYSNLVEGQSYTVVASHYNNSLAALVPVVGNKELDKKMIFVTNKYPDTPKYKVGRSSILFSSLVASFGEIEDWATELNRPLLSDIEEKELFERYSNIFKKGLNLSYEWCKKNREIIRNEVYSTSTNFDFRKGYTDAITKEPKGDFFELKHFSMKQEKQCWNEALKDVGFVTQTPHNENLVPKYKFQLWRAWSPVNGYISLNEETKISIAKLVRAVEEFKKDPTPQRSLCCNISGKSGWGKTFLVDKLAAQCNLKIFKFNTTQLIDAKDLMNCFDEISSFQTQNPGKPVIIFWDEINAMINSQYIYSYFLGPIWDGIYRNGGQTFKLNPCIWIFAGTDYMPTTNPSDKSSDFNSRINGPQINLSATNDRDLQPLEQMYTAVALIKRMFPNILQISYQALEYLKTIKPRHGVRSIEFIISQIKVAKNGKLTLDDLPDTLKISELVTDSNRNDINLLFKVYENTKKYEKNKIEFARIYTAPPPYDSM